MTLLLPLHQPVGERPNSEVLKRTEAGGYPKSTDASVGHPQGQLKAAEDKALRLEQLLEAATAREAVSSSERRVLRKQLDETEQLVSGLSQQLDSVQLEAAEQRRQCEGQKSCKSELQSLRQSFNLCGTWESRLRRRPWKP